MRTSAIVLAAGKSERFGRKTSKPLFKIGHKPIIVYSLSVLSASPWIKEIIVVGNTSNLDDLAGIIEKYGIKKIKAFVLGGLRRQDSVKNGLAAVSAQSDIVLVHDAARPFIKDVNLSGLIKEAVKWGASVLAVPVKATVKEALASGLTVKRTLDRSRLWEAQTPQVFKKELLLRAYKRFGTGCVTDDAALVEKLGIGARLVAGTYSNIKITTPEDLAIAEAIMNLRGV